MKEKLLEMIKELQEQAEKRPSGMDRFGYLEALYDVKIAIVKLSREYEA